MATAEASFPPFFTLPDLTKPGMAAAFVYMQCGWVHGGILAARAPSLATSWRSNRECWQHHAVIPSTPRSSALAYLPASDISRGYHHADGTTANTARGSKSPLPSKPGLHCATAPPSSYRAAPCDLLHALLQATMPEGLAASSGGRGTGSGCGSSPERLLGASPKLASSIVPQAVSPCTYSSPCAAGRGSLMVRAVGTATSCCGLRGWHQLSDRTILGGPLLPRGCPVLFGWHASYGYSR